MKKNVLTITSIVFFIVSLVFTTVAAQGITELKIASGSVGGNWYPVASAIAEYFNEGYGQRIATGKPGGGIGNPISVSRGQFEAGMSFSSMLLNAQRGESPYEEKYDNLKSVIQLFPHAYMVMAGKEFPYDTIEEIVKNKYPVKIAPTTPGNSDFWITEKAFEVYGATFDDIRAWGGKVEVGGAGEMAELYKDRHVDVAARHTSYPSSDFMEMAMSRPSKMIELGEEAYKTLRDRYNMQEVTVKGGSYSGIEKDYKTIGMPCVLFVREDVPDEIVYQLVKTVVENQKRLAGINEQFERFDPYTAWKDLGIELHPGAEQYFVEMGYK